MTTFLINPGGRRKRATRKRSGSTGARKRKRRPPKGYKTWKAYMASIRPGAKRKRKSTKRSATKKRRRVRRATSTGGKIVAKRARVRRRRRSAAPSRRRRRRGYRRNPPFMSALKHALTDGAAVTAGKALTRMVSDRLPLPKTGAVGVAVQLGVATAVGMLASKFARGASRMVAAGAAGAVLEDAIVAFNVPILSPALSAYPTMLEAYPLEGLAELPRGSESETDLPSFAEYGAVHF